MSVDLSGMQGFHDRIQALKNDIPEIMDQLAVGEGRYARDQARKICKEEKIHISGEYRRNFKSGTKSLRVGNSYKIDVYNNLDYASYVEYGFRSHFVPGHWEGHTFVHQRNDEAGGMYVGPYGGYVRGRFVLRRAVKRTEITQAARLNRKMNQIINQRVNGRG